MTVKNESAEAVKAGLYEVPEVIIDDLDNFYRNWLDAGREQLAAFDRYLGSVRAGPAAVARKALALAAENATSSLDFARALMHAKDPRQVLDLQLEFYQKQSEVFAAQLQDLGRTVMKAAERAR
jgi:hypothetical protein